MTLRCCLCQETFISRKLLLTHERTKHRNNKTIPHFHLLLRPSFEQLISYQDAFIILIKKRLGFNRHSVGTKRVLINVFPENVFVYLFQSEPSFRYNTVLRKYRCTFKGEVEEQRLKQILNYEHWSCRQDPITKTTGYVLFVNYEESHEVTFSWTQTKLVENNRTFQCGVVTCTFTTDSGEFVNENDEKKLQESESHITTPTTKNNQSQYRIILSRNNYS
uniref:C2H2-type domain-containing protein n=1 Tax=Rhizophagus irregularis (strain DAOM 181602 / DAOM 197198 / MUCL 43194) TaxID=747089 RepID=U9UFA6_RHIID